MYRDKRYETRPSNMTQQHVSDSPVDTRYKQRRIDQHTAVRHPTPRLTHPRTGMYHIAATVPFLAALLTADQAAAFVSHGPALGLKDRTTSRALSAASQSRCPCRHPCIRRPAGSATLSLSSNGANGPPSWRYEIDDLIKAASPWRGSIVETEIILSDLVKVG